MTELEREIRKYEILATLVVRGCGSHGRRCLWDICGKPMIQWVLEAAKDSKYINRIIVVTEDKKIKETVENLGFQVIDRALQTAVDAPRDYTEGIYKLPKPRSLIHLIPRFLENANYYLFYYLEEAEGYVPDLWFHLSAHNPMGRSEIADKVIEAFFKDPEAEEAADYYPALANFYILNASNNQMLHMFYDALDRQDFPKFYRKGSFHISGRPLKKLSTSLRRAYVITVPEEGLSVHEEEDLFLAQCYMKRRLEREKNNITLGRS